MRINRMQTGQLHILAGLVAITLSLSMKSLAGTPPCRCTGDATGDGLVNVIDLLEMLAAWGPCSAPCPPSCPADFSDDCVVNVMDLLGLLGNWGECETIAPDPGPSLPLATNLGLLTDVAIEKCEFIGIGDIDVYQFQLIEALTVNIALTNRVNGIRVWIVADFDADGIFDNNEAMEIRSTNGSGDISISADLPSGTYFIWLAPEASGAFTAYAMRVTSIVLPVTPSDPGESMLTAFDLGSLSDATLQVQDVVGGFDSDDVYSFNVTETRDVNINVIDRTEGVNVWLVANYDNEGIIDIAGTLAFSDSSGASNIALVEDLVPGTYHIWINPDGIDDTTRYTLQITSTPLPTLPVEPGDSLPTAFDLGVIGDTLVEAQDVVGGFDSIDVLSFTLSEARNVNINVVDRTEGVNVWLLADIDDDGFFDNDETLVFIDSSRATNIALAEDLVPGTYHLWITPDGSDDSTRYTLQISAIALPSLPMDPGESFSLAYDLGTISDATVEEQDVLGGFDTDDVFSFIITETRNVNVNVFGRTEGVRVWLASDNDNDGIFDNSETIRFSSHFGTANVSLIADLMPGMYFIWIKPDGSDDSTRYTLRLTSQIIP